MLEIAQRGVTGRAVLLGLLLIPVNVFWVTVVEVKWYSLDGSCLPLFVTPVFILFVLVSLNLLARRLLPRFALSRGELLVVYIMVALSETLAGHDMLQNLMGTIIHPYRFATPENRWEQLFFHYLPSWLTIPLEKDHPVIKGFYEGNTNLYDPDIYRPWLKPLAAWSALIFTLIFMMLCLNVLIRRQWTVNERLTYPIIQLPLELTREEGVSFFRSKVMWAGFATAFVLGALGGLHHLYPFIPAVNVKQTDLRPYLTTRPWNAIRRLTVSFYPFMIGLAFFLPLDLSFSCWFFFVVRLAQIVFGALMGWDRGVDFPYLNEQGAGSWLALALMAIVGMRPYWPKILQALLQWDSPVDREEPMRYRWAVLGFWAGAAFVLWFSWRAGMSLLVGSIFFTLYFLLSLAMTRVRAELGTPHEIYFVNPRRIMAVVAGSEAFSNQDLSMMSFYYWFNRCYRCHPMPNQLEAFKMAESANISSRRLLGVFLLATLFSMVVTYWANLHLCYAEGATAKCRGFKSWLGWESFNQLASWLQAPQEVLPAPITALSAAFLFTVVCQTMRRRFLWWPFHPAGYALAVSFAMDYFWFAVFVAWLIKAVILRYGGMRLYRQAMPFFLGAILGDYTIGSLWAIIGPAANVLTYKIFI